MIDVSKQIQYWLCGAQEDWNVAHLCLENNKIRHALFLAHLTLEKALKAHVCAATQDIPPKIHNLRRLYDISGVTGTSSHYDILAAINQFNIEGRYPGFMPVAPEIKEARILMQQVGELYQWLINQL